MKTAIRTFERLICFVKSDAKLFRALQCFKTEEVDKTDILRWQWAQCVSVFDKLMHDIVLIGMIEAYVGNRKATDSFNAFKLTLNDCQTLASAGEMASSCFEKIVQRRHSVESFQDPKKVSDALGLIWDEPHRWQKIAKAFGGSEEQIKDRLKLIVQRRNQIVHEGDYSSQLLQRQTLTLRDTRDVVDFISKLGKTIVGCVSNNSA